MTTLASGRRTFRSFTRLYCEPLESRDVPASLGTALFYNVLIFDDLTVPVGSDSEGRVAVGGNATFFDNYVIGAPPPFSSPHGAQLPLDPTRDDFIVGGNINNLGGFAWVVNANAVYEGTFTGTPLMHSAGTTRQQTTVLLSPINGNAVTTGGNSFAQLRAELIAKSDYWSTLADRGVAIEFRNASVLNLVGTDPVLNVFNLTAAQWGGTDVIRNIEAPAGSTVLINVSGTAINISGGDMRLNVIGREDVLVNFFEAETINSTLFSFEASVLAPEAAAVFNGGLLVGNGVFESVVQGGGFENHNFSFRGNLPDIPVAVPVTPPPPPPPSQGDRSFEPQLGRQIAPMLSPGDTAFSAGAARGATSPFASAEDVSKRMFLTSTQLQTSNSTNEQSLPQGAPLTAARLGDSGMAYATGPGRPGVVIVLDTRTGNERFRLTPFPGFTGGLSIAGGDVTGDGVADLIVAPGAGGGPNVKVFDGRTGTEMLSFFAYDPSMTGGVNVAVGDLDGDGRNDIITAPASAGGPNVRVFDGTTGAMTASIFAYAESVRGGLTLAVGDVDGNGRSDLITAPTMGYAPHVIVWRFDGGVATQLASFFAFEATFFGGVNVAAADVDGDGRDDILATAGPGGGATLRGFSAAGDVILDQMIYDAGYRGGLGLTAGDMNGDGIDDLLFTPASGHSAVVRLLIGGKYDRPVDFDLVPEFPGVFVG